MPETRPADAPDRNRPSPAFSAVIIAAPEISACESGPGAPWVAVRGQQTVKIIGEPSRRHVAFDRCLDFEKLATLRTVGHTRSIGTRCGHAGLDCY